MKITKILAAGLLPVSAMAVFAATPASAAQHGLAFDGNFEAETSIASQDAAFGRYHRYDRRYKRGYERSSRYGHYNRYDRYDRRRDRRRHYRSRRCDNGTGGTVIGAIAGGLLGNEVAARGDKAVGTIIGAAVGGIAGRAIDKADDPCRRRYRR